MPRESAGAGRTTIKDLSPLAFNLYHYYIEILNLYRNKYRIIATPDPAARTEPGVWLSLTLHCDR